MVTKNNIGKGNDAFKIAEDGTIIRADEPKQPDKSPKSDGKGWVWILVIAVIAGIGIYVYVESNNNSTAYENYNTTVYSSGDNNVIVAAQPADEDFDDFLSKFTNSSVFQEERTTVSTGSWTFEENFFGEGYVYLNGETYCGSWQNSDNKRVYQIGWCESELFAKLTFTKQNGLWYLTGFIEYNNNY